MVLKLVGPLTLSTIFGFQNELRSMTPQVLILDFSETPYMDSAGLGLMMNSYVSAQDHGRRLLLAGVNERVIELFKMTQGGRCSYELPYCRSGRREPVRAGRLRLPQTLT